MTSRRAPIQAENDAYGQLIWNCHQGLSTHEIIEREDGLLDLGSALPYFQPYDRWPVHEREAIRHACGPVLDVGCGAGRVSLYLQDQGHQVLAIDNSPLAVKVSACAASSRRASDPSTRYETSPRFSAPS